MFLDASRDLVQDVLCGSLPLIWQRPTGKALVLGGIPVLRRQFSLSSARKALPETPIIIFYTEPEGRVNQTQKVFKGLAMKKKQQRRTWCNSRLFVPIHPSGAACRLDRVRPAGHQNSRLGAAWSRASFFPASTARATRGLFGGKTFNPHQACPLDSVLMTRCAAEYDGKDNPCLSLGKRIYQRLDR